MTLVVLSIPKKYILRHVSEKNIIEELIYNNEYGTSKYFNEIAELVINEFMKSDLISKENAFALAEITRHEITELTENLSYDIRDIVLDVIELKLNCKKIKDNDVITASFNY